MDCDCDLCEKRAPYSGIFVANPDDTFTCGDCIPLIGVDPADPNVEVWEIGSEGWLEPVQCDTCGNWIDVVVNGNTPDWLEEE